MVVINARQSTPRRHTSLHLDMALLVLDNEAPCAQQHHHHHQPLGQLAPVQGTCAYYHHHRLLLVPLMAVLGMLLLYVDVKQQQVTESGPNRQYRYRQQRHLGTLLVAVELLACSALRRHHRRLPVPSLGPGQSGYWHLHLHHRRCRRHHHQYQHHVPLVLELLLLRMLVALQLAQAAVILPPSLHHLHHPNPHHPTSPTPPTATTCNRFNRPSMRMRAGSMRHTY